MKTQAFTLAETLITLGIIGIVAAMTLPSIVAKIRNKELRSRFKTAYALVSQTVTRMGNEEDLVGKYCGYNIYNMTKSKDFIPDFAKYFNGTITKGDAKLKIGYKSRYFLQAAGWQDYNVYDYTARSIILKNGMIIFTGTRCEHGGFTENNNPNSTPRPVDFMVDTNGVKGPNRLGYDVFAFQILRNNVLMPSRIKHEMPDVENSACCNFETNTCGSRNGIACTYFAVINQCPHDPEKTYWECLP